MSKDLKRRRESARTNWKKEHPFEKNPSYERKIELLEMDIENIRSLIRVAEEMLKRYFNDAKNRPREIGLVINLLKDNDGVSSLNRQDRHQLNHIQDRNTLENITELYEYLQGIRQPADCAITNLPKLPEEIAWQVIWVLQERFHVLPSNIEHCDECGSLYDSYSEGHHSEITGKGYCGACYTPRECICCGDEVEDEAWDESIGDYICDECRAKELKDL